MSLHARLSHSPALAPFSLPAFRRWALVDVVSVSGSWMHTVALSILMLRHTGSAALLGLTLTIQFLPSLLLGMWAGGVVDRHDRRTILLLTQAAHVALACTLAGSVAFGVASVPLVWACVVLHGLVNLFDGPALGVYGQEIVGPALLPAAFGLSATLNSTGRILGMGSAPAVIGLVDVSGVFAYNALSYALVLFTVWRMSSAARTPLRRETERQGAARAGWRYIFSHRQILWLLLLLLMAATFGRNMTVAAAALMFGPLHGSEQQFASLSALFSVGALAGGLLGARLAPGRLLLLVALVYSSAGVQALSALTTTPWAYLLCAPPLGALMVTIDCLISARIVLATIERMRARISATLLITTNGATAVGAPSLGWLCEVAGPRPAVLGFATCCALSVSFCAVMLRRRDQAAAAHERSGAAGLTS